MTNLCSCMLLKALNIKKETYFILTAYVFIVNSWITYYNGYIPNKKFKLNLYISYYAIIKKIL